MFGSLGDGSKPMWRYKSRAAVDAACTTGQQHALEGIGQKGEALALNAAAHSQTCQHHHRDGVWHVAPKAPRTCGNGHGTRCQGHVGLHRAVGVAQHKRSCGPAALVAKGPLRDS